MTNKELFALVKSAMFDQINDLERAKRDPNIHESEKEWAAVRVNELREAMDILYNKLLGD